MIIIGVNNNDDLIYVYTEDKSRVEYLLSAIKNGKVENCTFFKNYMVIIRERDSGKYFFFYDEYKNSKDAKHATKVLLSAVLKSNSILSYNITTYNESEHIILHNAKNIIHNITTSLRKELNYEELVYKDDKVNYINALVQKNTLHYARELLRCEKALEQVAYEYNCLDLITSGELLDSSDRTWEKIHSCLVQAFYIYENEFKDRDIRINIDNNYNQIFCNFFSIRSAFALLFENCKKYCKENSEVSISIEKQSDGSIKIDFDMISIFNTEQELDAIFLEHTRGEEAKKKESGKGLGLFLVQKLMEINGFSICMKRIPNTETICDNIKYCRNLMVIDIPPRFIK